MATKKDKTIIDPVIELRKKQLDARLRIMAHQEKNTNAHKPFRKQIAQELTKKSL